MAEVGLVPFAHLALQVAAPGLPPYRTRFSKHQFTQPQLLAVLCLMRYEDWTYREVQLRLREHSELRRALGLRRVPDHTTLYRFLRRLESGTIEEALGEAARREGRKPSLPGASPGGIPAKPNHPSPRKTPIIDAHSHMLMGVDE